MVNQFNCTVYLHKLRDYVGEYSVPMNGSDVSIPAHQAMEVVVHITRPTLKQYAEECAVELNRLPGFLAASRSSVRDDAVQVMIKVTSLSDDKFTVRRDSYRRYRRACTNVTG